MIIWRRPWPIYDVDVLGFAGALVLSAAALWLVLLPWQRTWQDYRTLANVRADTAARLRDEAAALARCEHELAPLVATVASQMGQVPTPDAFSRLLRRLTDLAQGSHLELLEVLPQPPVASGPYVLSDIQVRARGQSQDFIRFLNELAIENPYQSLLACTISRSANASSSVCELSWTTRLTLLPAATHNGPAGDKAAGGGAKDGTDIDSSRTGAVEHATPRGARFAVRRTAGPPASAPLEWPTRHEPARWARRLAKSGGTA